jgi:LysM repeat protein
VAIETPAELVVDFNVNGIDIQVGSLITLQMAAEDRLILSVHEGHVEASTGQVLDAGQSVEARLDRAGRIVGFEPIRPRTEAEVQLGALAEAVMDRLRPEAQVDFCDLDQVEHVIQRGETLFGIARQYDASMPAIVARNAIADLNVITVGRTLIIPNPCSGFIAAAQPRPTPAATAEPVDCSPFVITGITVQSQAALITWSPLPEAIFYELVTFANGQVIDVRQLPVTATSVGVEFGQVSYDQVDFQLIAYTAPGFAPCARSF